MQEPRAADYVAEEPTFLPLFHRDSAAQVPSPVAGSHHTGESLWSGSLLHMWVIREQTNSTFNLKGSRKECTAPWKHRLAWWEGIATISDLFCARRPGLPGSNAPVSLEGRLLSSLVILLCCNTPRPLHFTVPAFTWDTHNTDTSRCTRWLSSNKGVSTPPTTYAELYALLLPQRGGGNLNWERIRTHECIPSQPCNGSGRM